MALDRRYKSVNSSQEHKDIWHYLPADCPIIVFFIVWKCLFIPQCPSTFAVDLHYLPNSGICSGFACYKTAGTQSTCCLPRMQGMSILPYGFFNTHPHGPDTSSRSSSNCRPGTTGASGLLGKDTFLSHWRKINFWFSIVYKLTQDLSCSLVTSTHSQ